MPKLEFVKDDNTDRDYPDAFEITGAEFKIGDDYVCAEPCGGGGEHLLGDQHVYVETWGDDSTPVYPDPERIGCKLDPFATITRAFEYINSIVTIHGVIFLHLGAGEFFISEIIKVIHPNKIVILGIDYSTDNIVFTDSVTCDYYGVWYGSTALIVDNTTAVKIIFEIGGLSVYFGDMSDGLLAGHCSDGTIGVLSGGQGNGILESITFATETDSSFFGNLSVMRQYFSSCSNGIIGLNGGGFYSNVKYDVIDTFIFKISANATDFGDLEIARYASHSFADDSIGFFMGGRGEGTNDPTFGEMFKTTFSIKSNANYFGDLLNIRAYGGACSDRTTGLIGCGNDYMITDVIESLIMASASFTTDWGNLTAKTFVGGCSSGVYGAFVGGNLNSNAFNRVHFSTKVVNLDFGNILTGTSGLSGLAGN